MSGVVEDGGRERYCGLGLFSERVKLDSLRLHALSVCWRSNADGCRALATCGCTEAGRIFGGWRSVIAACEIHNNVGVGMRTGYGRRGGMGCPGGGGVGVSGGEGGVDGADVVCGCGHESGEVGCGRWWVGVCLDACDDEDRGRAGGRPS